MIKSKEIISGNIFIRPIAFERKGEVIEGHTHTFDHTTIFFRGSFKVVSSSPEGVTSSQIISAPSHLLIEKDWKHEITAQEDDSEMWCVYSHRNANGEVEQEYNSELSKNYT